MLCERGDIVVSLIKQHAVRRCCQLHNVELPTACLTFHAFDRKTVSQRDKLIEALWLDLELRNDYMTRCIVHIASPADPCGPACGSFADV